MEGANREEFLNRIRRWDTDLDSFRRNDYETFIRPHQALFDITLAEFTDPEQSIIRQFYATGSDTTSIELRRKLRDVITRGDTKLVSSFQRLLSERRRRFRMLDPETDARLAFWGENTDVVSDAAQSIHGSLFSRYGIQSREVVPVVPVDPLAPSDSGLTQ